jgi:NAD(P)-dependent dehydrogenase (short-subunit alcohol dehydrogenase family)
VTSSKRGQVVGKECDHGPDELLTHHASCGQRAFTELGWKAAHPRGASDGEPEEQRVDNGVGIKNPVRLVEAEGRRAVTVRADIRDPGDRNAVVAAAINQFGRVDIFVNNAGVGTAVAATRETREQFRAVMDVNLNGCYWMAQATASSVTARDERAC